jgi:dTMP kinase
MTRHYLAFDGIDGAGKHEQIDLIGRVLASKGVTPIHLLEPSYGPHGRKIRQSLEEGGLGTLDEQRDLFTLDRRNHVQAKIKPLLTFAEAHAGFIILQSRSYLSAAAYQAVSDDPAALKEIVEEQRAFAPDPDLILILDLPVAAALERLDRSGRRDSLETFTILEKARTRYVQLAKMYPHCILIDASGTPDEVAARVRDAVFGRPGEGAPS